MQEFHNCHVHLFTARAVPNRFILGMPIIRGRVTGRLIGSVLKRVNPFSASDRFARLAGFSTIGRLESAERVLELLRGYYTEEFSFGVMSLDMEYMGAGRAPQPYLDQLAELATLKADPRYSECLHPFVCADPRRPRLTELVRRYVERYDFTGIKIYPPLGFWPFDERLDDVYAYAERYGIPVLAHASRGGAHYRGRITDELRVHPRTGKRAPGWRRRSVTESLADPDNWRYVLDRFPELKLCLAHYGGGKEWHRYLTKPLPVGEEKSWIRKVNDLIRDFPNVFADLAYTAFEPAFLPLAKVLCDRPDLRHRILFGSDFYMVQRNVSERQFGIALRAAIGEEAWRRVAGENARTWLTTRKPRQVRVEGMLG